MPDENGLLSDEEQDKIRKWWLDGRWKGPVKCFVCQTDNWTIVPHVVNIQRHSSTAYAPGSLSFPLIMISCDHCTHTVFFNAVAAGVADSYDRSLDPNRHAALPPPKVR